MADKTLFIFRNDPAKKRKKLGKVKDLMDTDWNEMDEAKEETQETAERRVILLKLVEEIVPFFMGEKIFNMANNPKFKYFTDLDDHMMNFDDKLVNEIDLFISNLN